MTAISFVTDEGVVVPAVTADQMREIDRIAIEETGPNLFQMMENAGRNLALTALRMVGSRWSEEKVVVLAGTGGNGGGGICAARHLANRGVEVTVVITDETRLTGVPRGQLEVFRQTSGRQVSPTRLESLEPTLVVDAIVGYSLEGHLRSAAREMVDWSGNLDAPMLSLDVPSGINASSGVASGAHVNSAKTMTLALPKTGLHAQAAGDLCLGDIGIPANTYRRAGIEVDSRLFGSRYVVPINRV